MGLAQPNEAYLSEADYLHGEEASQRRHEYLDGVVYGMAGASTNHNEITLNAAMFLRMRAPAECNVFTSDMKVRIQMQSSVIYYYPDVVVSCAATDRATYYRAQPCLIIEVLSRATARQDRGEKFLNYQQLPSLQEYLLVAQDRQAATLFRRAAGWQPEVLHDGVLRLDAVGVEMPIAELYRRVRL